MTAKTGRRYTRATVEKNIAELLERIAEVNASETMHYWVDEAWLFGSALDDTKADYGDVDVVVRITRRGEFDPDEAIAYAAASGRSFSTYLDQLAWGETETWKKLKGGRRVVSVHNAHLEFDRLTGDKKLLYLRDV